MRKRVDNKRKKKKKKKGEGNAKTERNDKKGNKTKS